MFSKTLTSRASNRQTHILLRQGVHQLGEDSITNDSFRQVVVVVGKTPKGQRSTLLNTWYIVQ